MENSVSERITDIGSAGGGSLEGPNKGKCTDQEMLLDIVNGPNIKFDRDKENDRDTCKRADNDDIGGKDEKRDKDKGSIRDVEQSRVKGPYRDKDLAMDKEPDRGDGIGRDKKPPDKDKENIPDRDKGPVKIHNNGWIRMINILVWVIMSYCDVLSGDTSKW